MKQYVVLKHYNLETILPDVVGQFASESDAMQFARLSRTTDSDHRYSVARLIAVTK